MAVLVNVLLGIVMFFWVAAPVVVTVFALHEIIKTLICSVRDKKRAKEREAELRAQGLKGRYSRQFTLG